MTIMVGRPFEGFVTDRVEDVVRGDGPPLGESVPVTKLPVHDHLYIVEQLCEVEVEYPNAPIR